MEVDILIIDDEVELCEIMVMKFTKKGYKVKACHSAQEAESFLSKSIPPLILCDINMPKKSGLEFVNDLREKRMPCAVVMITAYADKEKMLEAMRLGCVDFITKPFKFEHLFDCLPLWLEIGTTLQRLTKEKNLSEVEQGLQMIDTIRVKANLMARRRSA